MATSSSPDMVLASSFDEIERLEPFVQLLQEKLSFNEDTYNRIYLTLSEAVNNAIVHGNRQDPDKKVVVESRVGKNLLILKVRDEGEGFDPAAIPDPLKEENLLNEGGRGIYLIQQFADEVQFGRDGSEIILHFALDSAS